MKSLLDLYGMAYQDPRLSSDSQDYTTADALVRMARNRAYDDSLFGQATNWLQGQKKKFAPTPVPDDASPGDQASEAGTRLMNLVPNLMLDGAQTANNWMGATAFPEKVETVDMLAPLGLGAMVGPFMPRGAVGSAGGRLAQTADDTRGVKAYDNNPRAVLEDALSGVPEDVRNFILNNISEHNYGSVSALDAFNKMVSSKYRGRTFEQDFPGWEAQNRSILEPALRAADDRMSEIMEPTPAEATVYRGLRKEDGRQTEQWPVWGSDSAKVAGTYAEGYGLADSSPTMSRLRAAFQRSLTADAKGGTSYSDVDLGFGRFSTDDAAKWAASNGYDGLVLKNISDASEYRNRIDLSTVYAGLKPGSFINDVSGSPLLADTTRSSLPGLMAQTADNALDMSHEARMARAKEIGFDTDNILYHGTAANFDEFKLDLGGATSGSRAGSLGVSSSRSPEIANEFAERASLGTMENSSVLPLLHRSSKRGRLTLDGSEKNLEVAATLADSWDAGFDSVLLKNYSTPSGKNGDVVVVKDPSQLRSVNAAFDPSKSDSANLLAADQARGSLPGLLAQTDDQSPTNELMRLLQQYGVMP